MFDFIEESVIDYPQETLSPEVWLYDEGQYVLKPEVKDRILEVLSEYPELDLFEIAKKIHIVGSIASNQYAEDTDIDIHLQADSEDLPTSKTSEEWQKDIIVWFDKNRDIIAGYAGDHPFEVYLQLNPYQDYMSDGIYDLEEDKWIKGPRIADFGFDPYETYKSIYDEIAEVAKEPDKLFGELKRDLIDYLNLKKVVGDLSPAELKSLKSKLENKLREIIFDIESLAAFKKHWSDLRKQTTSPESIEQALELAQQSKEWDDVNVTFKLLNRYQYLKVINLLNDMIKDNYLTNKEIENIKDLMGVM